MRVFTIIYSDGVSFEVEADSLSMDQGLAQFFVDGITLVGLAVGWAVIKSDTITRDPGLTMGEVEAAVASLSGVAVAARGERPTVAEAEAATREKVQRGRGKKDEGPVYVDETDELIVAADAHDSATSDPPVVSGARPEASEPDAPGVSDGPAPDPGETTDANPEPSEGESTGADDPPASSEDLEVRADRLRAEVGSIYSVHTGQPIINEFVNWIADARPGMQVNVQRMTLEDLEATVAWFKEHGITADDPA